MIVEYYNGTSLTATKEMDVEDVFDLIEKAHLRARRELVNTQKAHVLYTQRFYNELDDLVRVRIYWNMCLSDEELDAITCSYPECYFNVLHKQTCKKACEELLEQEEMQEIGPVTLKVANEFVKTHHRHNTSVAGCKFTVGLYCGDDLIGVAICGRPVSRHLDNGKTCEITRVCTTGGVNACSKLYSACVQIAKAMGYKKIITYTLKSENGASLKASGFICEDDNAGGTHWTGVRNKGQNFPGEKKCRWVKNLA